MSGPTSRHLADPELLGVLDMIPTLQFSDAVVAVMRERGSVLPMPPIPETRTQKRIVAVARADGSQDVPLTIYTPAGDGPFGCILHMHGGGYVVGSAAAYEPAHRPMAEQLGCIIASVDYRHAPETTHPGPVEDCYAALAHLFANADALGIDRARVGVMGESAGGGMAAALAVLARDRGEFSLAFQHLVYPMIDDRTGSGGEPNPHAGELIWTPQNNSYAWRAYLGRDPGGPDTSPYAAAARADDLRGLPSCFMLTAALDLFIDENIDYARRLIRAGVPTELQVMPGAFHAFDAHPTAEVAVRARRLRIEALERALRPGPQPSSVSGST